MKIEWHDIYDSRTGQESTVENAILTSQPQTGGLYSFFEGQLPRMSLDEIQEMVGRSYQDTALMVLSRYNLGVSNKHLYGEIIQPAYSHQWHNPAITPVKTLDKNLHGLNLGCWPTFAFKNVALEFLPRLLSLLTQGKIINVLGASSGDTINAAHHGVKWTSINSIFGIPEVWPFEVQMMLAKNGIVDNPNAFTLIAQWLKFDDLQAAIIRINTAEFADFKAEHNITSFNSINIARILAQIVYYFRAYAELIKTWKIENGQEVVFSVPSGNFGNALAGLYAREMGLPIASINVATNENDMLHEFFLSGIYKPKTVITTNAPSQDISKSNNFERAILWACWDPAKVAAWYKELKDTWSFKVDPRTFSKLQSVFTSSTSTNDERLHAIEVMANEYGHGIDFHSATAYHPHLMGEFDESVPVIGVETSHPTQVREGLTDHGIAVPGIDEHDETLDAMRKQNPVEGKHYITTGGGFDQIFKDVKRALEIVKARK